jgi:hypothetical protein
MATEEFSQGAALGPENSETAGDPPATSGFPDLHEVQGEFMVALSVIDVVARALMELSDAADQDVGTCALALKHGCEMLDAVYNRFDEGLMAYDSPDDDDPQDLDDNLDLALDEEDLGSAQHPGKAGRGGGKHSTLGKRRALALVA